LSALSQVFFLSSLDLLAENMSVCAPTLVALLGPLRQLLFLFIGGLFLSTELTLVGVGPA
jgi:hypothetical protein